MRLVYHCSIFLLLGLLLIPSVSGQKSKKKKKKDELVTISTQYGEIHLLLFDETPIHKKNFIKLADEGFFNGTTFHRVIKNFMIQGGDPNSKEGGKKSQIGRGGPGYTLEAEILPQFKHNKGMLAAARQADPVNPERRSSGSQFYIVQNPKGAHHLDGAYTIFGKVINGIEVVDKIAEQAGGGMNKESIRMEVTVEKTKVKKLKKMFPDAFANETKV